MLFSPGVPGNGKENQMAQILQDEPINILVVDDEEAIGRMLQTGIQMAGYHCLATDSPGSALQLLAEHPVDVLVADIRMPEMSGIELGRIVKERYDADVIIMTGYVDDFNYEDIVQQGANDFIQKPVRIAEFIARLKRVIGERASKQGRIKALRDLEFNLNKLRRAMDGIVQAISVVVEKRDPYTAGHQQRVAELACAAAAELGLADDDIYGLRMASVIHDLGKITVPDGILARDRKSVV
jgi:response regulator RpfG family c-di-GMP phosphodiesterase